MSPWTVKTLTNGRLVLCGFLKQVSRGHFSAVRANLGTSEIDGAIPFASSKDKYIVALYTNIVNASRPSNLQENNL